MEVARGLEQYRQAFEKAGILREEQVADRRKQPVENITFDSREVVPGTLFFCKGAHFEEAYLAQSMEQGAFCYVSERVYTPEGREYPYLLVTNIRLAMAIAADLFYGSAWKRLTLVGITGTKGKSTTAYFMKHILDAKMEATGHPESALLSSIDNYDGVVREESHLTTQEAIPLHRHFYHALSQGISHLTMEVSSHALKYHRTYGIQFEAGAFLNMGEDHISPVEHENLEDYVSAKMMLFAQSRYAVINLDQTHWKRALDEAEKSPTVQRIFTFTVEQKNEASAASNDKKEEQKAFLHTLTTPHAGLTALDLATTPTGFSFSVQGGGETATYTIHMPGIFNVSNALAAITVAKALNIDTLFIQQGLERTRVPGRMELFTDAKGEKLVLVDYAHNAMSYTALFDAVEHSYPGRPVYVVFGCPGGKAQGRRKELGEIAGRKATLSILTEEDAGEEPVHTISQEIASHVASVGGRYEMIDDREEAVRHAILDSPSDAVVLVLAKGRETRQKRGTGYEEIPSDVSLVEQFLKVYEKTNKMD